MMSGRRVTSFREGWAIQGMPYPFPRTAHYYVRQGIGLAKPICGAPERIAGYLWDAGDWTRCKRCSRRLAA